jgi:uncharacterized membrane protein
MHLVVLIGLFFILSAIEMHYGFLKKVVCVLLAILLVLWPFEKVCPSAFIGTANTLFCQR